MHNRGRSGNRRHSRAREPERAGRHNCLDGRAQFVGRGVGGSSACLREEWGDECPQFEEVGDAETNSPPPGQVVGVRDAQVRPFDGDAEYGSVGELEQHPLDAVTGAAVEQRQTPAPQGVEGMGDQNAGIRRTACSLPGW